MGIPQDWAPYSSVEEAAAVYLRDPELALDGVYRIAEAKLSAAEAREPCEEPC